MSETRGRKNGEFLFNENRISVLQGEKVLELDDGDSYTIMRMSLMPPKCVIPQDSPDFGKDPKFH